MNALFSIAASLDAIPAADPFGEAVGACSRGITAVMRGRTELKTIVERSSYLAPSEADSIRELRRRLREEDAKLGAILKINDPFGLDEPIDAALILSAYAPDAQVQQAAE